MKNKWLLTCTYTSLIAAVIGSWLIGRFFIDELTAYALDALKIIQKLLLEE